MRQRNLDFDLEAKYRYGDKCSGGTAQEYNSSHMAINRLSRAKLGQIYSRMFLGFESTHPRCELKVPQAEYNFVHKAEDESISNPSSMVLRSSPTIPIVHVSLRDSLNRICDPRMSIGQLRERDLSCTRAPFLSRHDKLDR